MTRQDFKFLASVIAQLVKNKPMEERAEIYKIFIVALSKRYPKFRAKDFILEILKSL